MRKTMAFTGAMVAVVAILATGPRAFAASVNPVPPGWLVAPGGAQSAGVGFCIDQVAQHPDYMGASSLGAAMSVSATSGPGNVPAMIDDTRYPLCGGPGSGE